MRPQPSQTLSWSSKQQVWVQIIRNSQIYWHTDTLKCFGQKCSTLDWCNHIYIKLRGFAHIFGQCLDTVNCRCYIFPCTYQWHSPSMSTHQMEVHMTMDSPKYHTGKLFQKMEYSYLGSMENSIWSGIPPKMSHWEPLSEYWVQLPGQHGNFHMTMDSP